MTNYWRSQRIFFFFFMIIASIKIGEHPSKQQRVFHTGYCSSYNNTSFMVFDGLDWWMQEIKNSSWITWEKLFFNMNKICGFNSHLWKVENFFPRIHILLSKTPKNCEKTSQLFKRDVNIKRTRVKCFCYLLYLYSRLQLWAVS